MSGTNRRTFLKILGGAAAAASSTLPLFRALADTGAAPDDFFIFVHASGGWDVTLWSDVRNQRVGLIEPASTDNTDTSGVRLWVDQTLDADTRTFKPVQPSGSRLVFGPAIGDLAQLYDRLTVINGVAMNTVSHPDGTVYSATGRHLSGGRAVAASIDTAVANEFGTSQLLPLVSVNYPSSFVGDLDARATPLRVSSVGTVAKSLSRSTSYEGASDRDAVTAVLSQECADLAARSYHPEVYAGMSLQFEALRRMISSNLRDVFDANALKLAYPDFNYAGKYQGTNAVNAAFAVEAMKRNVVRCVSFALGGLDTHNGNYRFHAATLQEIFDMLAALVRVMDRTPHPTLAGEMLSAHTHVLVVSEFCRTPQINLAAGRDHYPNNSALLISPRFRGNTVYGSTDAEQLLPQDAGMFTDGMRPVSPPDILATLLTAVGVDPRKYLRDGEAVREILTG